MSAPSHVVPILGMHRSGTSAVTRALNLLGLALGEPLLEPGPDNPRGYWESVFFVRINAEILTAVGLDPNGFGAPAALSGAPGLCRRVAIEPHRLAAIRDYVARAIPAGAIWGFKDPRTVLTFNAWLPILRELGVTRVSPVIVVRSPDAVAESLVRRVESDPGASGHDRRALRRAALEQWVAYNEILGELAARAGCHLLIREWLAGRERRERELRRLASALGLGTAGLEAAVDSIEEDRTAPRPCGYEPADRLYDRLVAMAAEARPDASTARPDAAAARPGASPARSGGSPARADATTARSQASSLRADATAARPRASPARADLPAARGQGSASGPDATADFVARARRLRADGRVADAVHVLEAGVARRPDDAKGRIALAYALMETGHIGRALAHARHLARVWPDLADAHNLIGFGLTERGEIEAGIAAFRAALALTPGATALMSNIAFASLYSDRMTPEAITELHRDVGRRIETDSRITPLPPPASERDLPAPLRVGYLAADFRRHPVGYFMREVLAHHDRSRVQSWCYHTVPGGDDVTAALRSSADRWRAVADLDDEALARRIRDDAIDVLVDLSGHTAANRAGVLARRPAPVQCHYLGYPATTGLTCVDRLIVDPLIAPPSEASLYTEKLLHLPGCFLCFHPHPGAPPPVRPAEPRRPVTFGSFNHLSKVSSTTLDLWSGVLRAVPDSRLVMKALALTDRGARDRIRVELEVRGIAPDRVDLLAPTVPLEAFLAEYARIDVALDTYPYNGGTTTCEALLMGVPVVTLPGRTLCARMGLSLLTHAGLAELVARDAQHYVGIARDLAADPARLDACREDLRERLSGSSICDGPRFTRGLEDALERAWRERAGAPAAVPGPAPAR